MPPKSFTFTLRDRGGVSQLTGRKEDIRKRVVPEKFASTARFAVVRVRGLPCDVERLTLGELVLPVSDDWCFAEFHVTSKRCTSGSSAFRKVVLKTSDGCSSTCSGVGQNPQHAPGSFTAAKLGQYLLVANAHAHAHTHSHIHFRTFNVLSGFTKCLMVIFALKLLVDVFLNYEMNNVLCFFFFLSSMDNL